MKNDALKALIAEYVKTIEIGKTDEVCLCEWHNIPLPNGQVGKTLKTVNLECPVHTKEGLLLGFIKWLKDVQQLEGIYFNWDN